MPELSGLEATERVRAPEEEKGWDAVPIVALTARVMASDREKCVEAGMDDDQSKPIELADSRSVLEEAARGKTSGAAGIEATASDNGALRTKDGRYLIERGSCGGLPGIRSLWRSLSTRSEESQQYLAEIEAALERDDGEALVETAHALKEAAGNLQSQETEQAAARLEEAGRIQKLDRARPGLRRLKTAVDRLETKFLGLKAEVVS